MSLLLSIETAGSVCAAAISESGDIQAIGVLDEPRVHAARLAPMIKEVASRAGYATSELAAVAVSKGPGSFTGLRIGVSTAKGICFALGIPLIGVETFEAMATANVDRVESNVLVTILPSRRGEAYWQSWTSRSAEIEVLTDPRSDPFTQIVAELALSGRPVTVVGEIPEDLVADLGRSEVRARVLQGAEVGPTIEGVVSLATSALGRQQFENVAEFEPFYLKEFVAKKGGSPFDRLPF